MHINNNRAFLNSNIFENSPREELSGKNFQIYLNLKMLDYY